MSRFTPDDIATLKALVNFHVTSMGKLLGDPALPPHGRAQYLREIESATRLQDKLLAEYEDAVRLPEIVA